MLTYPLTVIKGTGKKGKRKEKRKKATRKTKMDLRKIEEIVKEPRGGIVEKKEAIISTLTNSNSNSKDGSSHDSINSDDVSNPNTSASASAVDSATALQMFLDHIPISSIPGIRNSPSSVVEVKTQELVKDGIRMLYEKNVSGALIADISESDPTTAPTFSHPYVGFIDFSSMVLWSLQEFKRHRRETEDSKLDGGKKAKANGFFYLLDQIPAVSQTKIGELAKSFLWDPVFLVNVEQTLFHVLLLLSKHQLSVVPVTEKSSSNVIGFVTESSVNHILLQSSGLEWFDSIADKPLSEFRLEHNGPVASIYGDQSVRDAMCVLWEKKVCALAVVKRQTERLIGCVRTSDAYHLLDKDDLFMNRGITSVEQFIQMDTSSEDPHIDQELGALISAGTLVLNNKFLPRMDSPVTNRETDTLKEAMKNLAETKSSFSFLIDKSRRVRGMLTLRDIIVQFAPPCMDSRMDGGGFFESALKQSGCTVRYGTMVHEK